MRTPDCRKAGKGLETRTSRRAETDFGRKLTLGGRRVGGRQEAVQKWAAFFLPVRPLSAPRLPSFLKYLPSADPRMSSPSLVVAIIHYRTPDLLRQAVSSFRDVYPDVDLVLVDNGSADDSTKVVEALSREPDTRAILLDRNEFHGPAMDRVLRTVDADAVFFLDSDTVTRRGGFLEEMLGAAFSSPDVLGVGKIVTVDRRGFAAPVGIPVPQSAFMLIRREIYLTLPPFVHHGLPVLATCTEAHRRGLRLLDHPVDERVDHLGRGTAEKYGYGLGLRSRIDYLLHRLGL